MPASVARRLDHRHLHAEADAEIGHLALAGEPRRPDLALRAALAEAAGHQDAVHALQEAAPGPRPRRSRLSIQSSLTLHAVGHAAVDQRLDQRLVGVLQPRVLADDGDGHLALGVGRCARRCCSQRVRSGARRVVDAEGGQHLAVEALAW